MTSFKEGHCDYYNKEETPVEIQNKWLPWKFINFQIFLSHTLAHIPSDSGITTHHSSDSSSFFI